MRLCVLLIGRFIGGRDKGLAQGSRLVQPLLPYRRLKHLEFCLPLIKEIFLRNIGTLGP